MKIGFISLGCSKNLVDTEQLINLAFDLGLEIVDNEIEADLIVINTCAFLKSARLEAEKEIRRIIKLKQTKNDLKIILTGCLVAYHKKSVLKKYPKIDFFLAPKSLFSFKDIIENLSKKIISPSSFFNDNQSIVLRQSITTPFYSAYLKIAEGCNNHCSYCLIPSIRGKLQSRPLEFLVKEAEMLAKRGVIELNIIAQDITAYGRDIGTSLIELLKKLEKIKGISWIRLLYAYPEGISDDLINFMASSDKICHYLDMPLQHSEAIILKKMNRKTNKNKIFKLIDQLRKKMPDICIRSTFMLGFPSETELLFQKLCHFLKEVKFDRAGFFAYSREIGTPAFEMIEQVEQKEKNLRKKIAKQIQSKISREKNKLFIGKEIDVLIESNFYGRTYRDAIDVDGIFFVEQDEKLGSIVKAKIKNALTYDLKGDLI